MNKLISALVGLALAAPAAALAAPAASPTPVSTPINIGQAIKSLLTAGDEAWEDGSHFDRYRFRATAGQKVRIEMNTPLLDAYLTLGRPGDSGKNSLAFDDDGADPPLDALVVYTIPTTGEYEVRASGVKASDLGDYTLSVWLDGTTKPTPSSAPAPSTSSAAASASSSNSSDDVASMLVRPTRTTPITVGQTLSGTLAAGDQKDDENYFVDSYSLVGRKGDKLLITLRSSEFDSLLYVSDTNSNDLMVSDDDTTTGLDSAVQVELPDNGTYVIQVTPNGGDGRVEGAYTLEVRTDPAPLNADEREDRDLFLIFSDGDVEAPKSTSRVNIAYGQTINGTLATTDKYTNGDKDSDRFYFDTYMFRAVKGDKVTIGVTSTAIKPDFNLYDPYNQYADTAETKDNSADLVYTVNRDGLYRLDVESRDANKTGAYSLTIRK